MIALLALDPMYCPCGMQLITPQQFREGRCEYCAVEGKHAPTVEEVRKRMEVRG